MFEFYEECIESGQPTALAGINEFVLTVQEPVSVIREHVCSSLLDRVSIGYDGTVYPCPETMKDKFAILNVHEPDTYEQFEPQRSLVLESLKKKNLQNLWFGNLMDICIGRISTNETGELHIDDVDSISDALEENLYRIAKSRAAEQNNVRVS
jgi:radical SAM protein with 4Fe4S-binding SPASM domain